MAETKPLLTYVTRHLVSHDGQDYPMGSEIRLTDDKAIAHLRKAGAIALPSELEPAEETAAREQRLHDENEALRAELEALRAERAEKAAATPKSAEKAAK